MKYCIMKKVWTIISIVAAFILFSTAGYGQCRTFAKSECRPALNPYVHDGIYNATELSEGESAELYKHFIQIKIIVLLFVVMQVYHVSNLL